ncbi:MAG: hypothetical protein ACXV5Q_01395 [Frankiaceae bacterium]
MADLKLVMNVLAKDSASATLGKIGDKAEHTGSKVKMLSGTFSKFGGILGGEVGEALNKVGEAFEKVGEKHDKLGQKMMAGGGALTGIGVLLQQIGSKDKAAMQQLDAAVAASGKGFDGFKEEVEKSVKAGENFGHAAPDTIEALRKLTQATQDPKKAIEEMGVVEDLAAAKHISLSNAAELLAKVHGGAGRMLKEFGLNMMNAKLAATQLNGAETQHSAATEKLRLAQQRLSDLMLIDGGRKKLSISQELQLRNARDNVKSATEKLAESTKRLAEAHKNAAEGAHAGEDAVKQLGQRLAGQAAAQTDTFSGKFDVLKAKVLDATAAFGNDFGGAVTAAGPILMGLGAVVTLFNGLQTARAARTAAAAAATDLDSASSSRNIIVLTASKVASLAAAAAQKAMAVAQWALNAALNANPIALVVIAIAALAAGIIYAYKHSATFRSIVQGAFSAVGAAASAMWATVKPVFRFLVDTWLSVAGAIIHGAASAFGWAGDIGKKLKSAAKEFDKFAAHVRAALSDIHPPPIVLQVQLGGAAGKAAATAIANKQDRLAGRAIGGSVNSGTPYLVGENGPEIVVPGAAGSVLTAPQTAALRSGTVINVNVTASGSASPHEIARQTVIALRRYKADLGGGSLGIA